jgi:hypothetical protein
MPNESGKCLLETAGQGGEKTHHYFRPETGNDRQCTFCIEIANLIFIASAERWYIVHIVQTLWHSDGNIEGRTPLLQMSELCTIQSSTKFKSDISNEPINCARHMVSHNLTRFQIFYFSATSELLSLPRIPPQLLSSILSFTFHGSKPALSHPPLLPHFNLFVTISILQLSLPRSPWRGLSFYRLLSHCLHYATEEHDPAATEHAYSSSISPCLI